MRNDPRALSRRIEVGRRLHELRRTSGLTQGELARAARLGQATLSNYESGRRDILLGMAERIAEALDVTFGFLLDVPHIWVIRDPELARAVRILADSEELLTSIVGPRPPPPPRQRRRRRKAQQDEGEATTGEADGEDGDAEAPDGEAGAAEAAAADGDEALTGDEVVTEDGGDAEAGAIDDEDTAGDNEAEATDGEDEARVPDGKADTANGEVEAGEAEPQDNEVEPTGDASGECAAGAAPPDAGAEA